MTNTRGETVKLSPGTWIALVVGAVTVVVIIVGALLRFSERLVRVEVNSDLTSSGVQSLVLELKPLSERVGKVESRVDRLEAK